jgi:hypothetical protein
LETSVVLVANSSNEIFFLQNPPAISITAMGDLLHAEMIYSKYGIVIRDTDSDKIWLYPLNDPESREKFNQAKSYLPGMHSFSDIAGHTRIRLPNS